MNQEDQFSRIKSIYPEPSKDASIYDRNFDLNGPEKCQADSAKLSLDEYVSLKRQYTKPDLGLVIIGIYLIAAALAAWTSTIDFYFSDFLVYYRQVGNPWANIDKVIIEFASASSMGFVCSFLLLVALIEGFFRKWRWIFPASIFLALFSVVELSPQIFKSLLDPLAAMGTSLSFFAYEMLAQAINGLSLFLTPNLFSSLSSSQGMLILDCLVFLAIPIYVWIRREKLN